MNLNFLAIILGVLAAYVFNAIWFGPKTFYSMWIKSMGREMPKREEMDMSAKAQIKLFGGTLAGQLAVGVVVALVIGLIPDCDAWTGALVGLGLGVVAAGASLGHRLFAYHGGKTWIIEVSGDIIGIILMGLVIGAF